MRKLALALSMFLLMCGCGGNPPSSVIEVSIIPATPANIDRGQTLQFQAKLAENAATPASSAVAWSVSSPGCAGASCGIVSPVTGASTTYIAPQYELAKFIVSV